jgi:hypothetical protein
MAKNEHRDAENELGGEENDFHVIKNKHLEKFRCERGGN